ncbi:MAG: 3'-5' exoribonuclease [Bacteroidales bacterium]|jgi:hypothetical protein
MSALTHLVFDIETLGNRSNAVCLSLACVPFVFEESCSFEEYFQKGFYVKFNPIEQLKSGRTTEKDTLLWWKKQSKEALEVTKPSSIDVDMVTGLNQLSAFIKSTNYNFKQSYNWCRAQDFDFPIMSDLYRQNGLEVPYNRWNNRDIKTYVDILTGSKNGYFNMKFQPPVDMVKHNALCDCVMDIMRMKEIYDSCI